MRIHLAGLLLAGVTGAGLLAGPVAYGAEPAAKAVKGTSTVPAANVQPARSADDTLSPLLKTLQIGTPMPQLPDCADKRTPDGADVTAFCVELRGDGMMRQVGVPRTQRPAFMDGPYALALVDRNALVGVILPTDGVRSEPLTLQTLSSRYGKPFRQETVPLLDKGGKTVQSVHAGWMQAPLTVEMYSMPDDPQTGTIELLLPRARTLLAARDAEVNDRLNPGAASAPAASAPAGKAKEGRKEKEGKAGSW